MRRHANALWLVAVVGLVVVLGAGAAALAANATGTWKWTVERNGNTFETTLKLKQDGEKLTGTITGRQGNETEIEDGKVAGDKVTFKVTREFGGNKIVFSYEGTLKEDTIKGTTKFERDGDSQSRDWEAKREK